MVPGSTFRYGSIFCMLTLRPRLSSRHPMEAAAKPLPREDTTPPVTKIYFADIVASCSWIFGIACRLGAQSIMAEFQGSGNWFDRRLEEQIFAGLQEPHPDS